MKSVHCKGIGIAMEDIKKGDSIFLDYFGRVWKNNNPCPKCEGKGYVLESDDPFYSMNPIKETCEMCQGLGVVSRS